MTLKTLKDILSPDNDWDETSEKKCGELLKAEAVKWIKEIESCHCGETSNQALIFLDWGNSQNNIIDWIKHFFNLTEEDLKKCEHDFGNSLLMSNPPQRRCIKCGYTEYVK